MHVHYSSLRERAVVLFGSELQNLNSRQQVHIVNETGMLADLILAVCQPDKRHLHL